MRRPKFNEARGTAVLTGKPPFDFEGVTMRVFPLRAEIQVLRNFINGFLNVAPDEIAHFRPYLPYVYLMVLNYGQMTAEENDPGWVAQNEVAFSVPLEWYRRERGKLVFQDWASICPFIFVDDEMSQYTGREVYGWPKVHGWLTAGVSPWTKHPRAPAELLKFSSSVFSRVFSGQRKQDRPILEVLQESPPTFTHFPPDPKNPLNPFLAVPNALSQSWSVMLDMMDAVFAMPARGFGERDSEPLPLKLARSLQDFDVMSSLPLFNTVNLKQFRDTERPDRACYQALINSKMTLTRLSEAGLLGDAQRTAGDLSAGYSIRMHEHDTFPVVSALGLEVSREEKHDLGEGEEARVAVLKPVLPFWSTVDFKYGVGEVVAQRARDAAWVIPGNGQRKDRKVGAPEEGGARYNTARGAASISVSGPFTFRDTAVRILPLMARRSALARLIDGYLNEGHDERPFRFEPWARGEQAFVYLVAQTFSDMSSEGMDVGQWASRSVRFVVPIRWRDVDGTPCIGGFSPFVYSNSQIGTTTGREWLGWPSELARIESSPDNWMASKGPGTDPQTLLSVRVQLLSGLHGGAERTTQRLLTITDGDVLPPGDARWRLVADEWGRTIREDLEAKEAAAAEAEKSGELECMKALALELLAHGREFNDVGLKQFRSSDRPDTACYQELVQSGTRIDHLWTLEEIEQPLHVQIRKAASQPIVEALGLMVKHEEIGSQGTVYHLQPIRPFWARFDMTATAGRTLCWRTDTEQWHHEDPGDPYFSESSFAPRVGRSVVRAIQDENLDGEEGERILRERRALHQDVASWARRWWNENRGNAGELLGREEALAAVETLSPDVVIDAILSQEWGHAGDHARLYRERVLHEESVEQKPPYCVRRDSVGPSADEVFPLRPDDGAFRCGMNDVAGWYPGEKPPVEVQREGA